MKSTFKDENLLFKRHYILAIRLDSGAYVNLSYLTPMRPHIVTKPWGGRNLARLKNIETSELVGETWEVSRLLEGSSQDAKGRSLSDSVSHPELPYLIKFIDTTQPLSVQVHPDDAYAAKNENSSGKTECWVILHAEEGAGLYLGFRAGVSAEVFFEAVDKGEDLSKFLEFYPVRSGDFFFVPAGSVHAIGAGITLAEIQQSSGVTYRVWDWNRVDEKGRARELHVKQAKDVLNFSADHNRPETFCVRNIFDNGENKIIEHEDFRLSLIHFEDEYDFVGINKRIGSLINLENEIDILDLNTQENFKLKPYQCCLVAQKTKLRISGGKCLVVE